MGSENSTPATAPPIAAPFSPCFFTAVSSSCTARSGACRVSEAKAAKRSGLLAQSSASFSFCILTIWPARSRSRPYQKGLIDSTSMSTAWASMASSRLSISMKASAAPLTGGSWTDGGVGAEQRAGLAEVAMGMDVDGLDLLAVDGDGQGAGRALRVRALEQAAAAEDDSGRGGGAALEEVSARGHGRPSED